MVIVFYWFNQTAFKAIFSFHSANFSETKKKLGQIFMWNLSRLMAKSAEGKKHLSIH